MVTMVRTLTANTTNAECHPDDTATETKTSLQCYKTPFQCQNSCGRSFAVTRLLKQEVGFDSLPGVKCSIGCRKILFYQDERTYCEKKTGEFFKMLPREFRYPRDFSINVPAISSKFQNYSGLSLIVFGFEAHIFLFRSSITYRR